MFKASVRKHVLERSRGFNEKENPTQNTSLFKNLKKIYPLGIQRSSSVLSISSLSLSSTDSFLTDSSCTLDSKILLSLESIGRIRAPAAEIKASEVSVANSIQLHTNIAPPTSNDGELKRCNWITKKSDKVYVTFHDEQWGVPVYEDNRLFELLAMSGMLMDYNWTEILKRKELLREAFGGFDPNIVANMGEKEITEVASNKELGLAECRARCIVENASGIVKIVKECGSFSSFMWGYFNYKPIINKYKYPRNVPLRSPKAEAISKELIRRGFRLVGPVITQSFIQAAGMTIDHLVDCFRYTECVSLAECPWRHV
ncbi:hypothetical protein Ancab_020942 [Ancistrocladus abbreviatus]